MTYYQATEANRLNAILTCENVTRLIVYINEEIKMTQTLEELKEENRLAEEAEQKGKNPEKEEAPKAEEVVEKMIDSLPIKLKHTLVLGSGE